MVDWDRVEQLRSKGWDWDRIAADEKVGFHPESSVRDAGRALRSLYHRQRSRGGRSTAAPTARPTKQDVDRRERAWNLPRIGMFATPVMAIYALLAYVAPSPVGILIPAFPWLFLGLAVAAFVLLFGLLRSEKKWTKVWRSTLISGVVVGLVLAGVLGLAGYVIFGCPYLPPSSALGNLQEGWAHASVGPWQESGKPVFYFYGATWCPFCSASSWAMWKALTEFQSGFNGQTTGIPGTSFMYSNPADVDPSTPEVVIGSLSVSSPALALQVSEYFWTTTSGVAGTFPSTSNCVQQAYVSAYSTGLPFVVLNGQYVHAGTLIEPTVMSSWAAGANGGYTTVANGVLTESGAPWSDVSSQAGWITAFLLKSGGYSTVAAFLAANPGLNNPSKYQWTTGMTGIVNADLAQLS
jgi:hypothetical protein